MKDYISEPFLLEKIVVELSCSLTTNGITAGGGSKTAIWSFFILNSKPTLPNAVVGTQTVYHNAGGGAISSFITSSISAGTTCDLVTYSQVSLYDPSNDIRGPVRDQVVPITRTPSFSYWSGQLLLSSSVKNPIQYSKGLTAGFSGYYLYVENLRLSGRSQINEINGRDWVNSFSSPFITGYFHDSSIGAGGIDVPILDSYTKTNPYLLLPSDKLTFGWHMPMKISDSSLTNNSNMTFSPGGINKIILYGSTLRVNPETNQLEEHHETLNQLFSSDSIHETIE
jgi:hypothetical protein